MAAFYHFISISINHHIQALQKKTHTFCFLLTRKSCGHFSAKAAASSTACQSELKPKVFLTSVMQMLRHFST